MLADFGSVEFVGTASTTISDPDPSMVTVNIVNGKPEFETGIDLEELLGVEGAGKVTAIAGKLGAEISKGVLSAGIEKSRNELTVSFSAVIEDEETSEGVVEVSQGYALKFDLTKFNNFVNSMVAKMAEVIDEHPVVAGLVALLIIGVVIILVYPQSLQRC